MAYVVADRIRDTTTTTGTGAKTVSDTAPTTYKTFSTVCSVNDTFYGFISHQTLDEWEAGLYTYSASNQITSTRVIASTNAGSAVSFSAGTKDVVLSQIAASINAPRNVQIDKGTVGTGTVTFDVTLNTKGRLQVSGALTVAFSNWPSAGTYAEFEIQLVNGGNGVTWPTVSWLKGDGTNSTTFSTMGVTLYVSGTNTVIIWSTDGGTTLYGKAA